jgi:YfiH family protein
MKPQLRDGFEWVEREDGSAVVCRPLQSCAHHIFTTRRWALGSADPNDGEAWSRVAAGLDVAPDRLLRLQQVHGASVVVRRTGAPLEHARPAADIIVSDDPGVAVAIQTADCVPLLIADSVTGAVGAAHAGWRGLAAGVPQAAVRAMHEQFGAKPRDLIVAIGPAISAARYEVDGQVRSRFEAAFDPPRIDRWFPRQTRPGHWEFDGWSAAVDQVVDAGVPGAQIYVAGVCTSEHPEFFCSYRRDGRHTGRMAAAIRAR